jgi:hypothetical protein
MDPELELVTFLSSRINEQFSFDEIPSHLRKDRHATDAWLRDLKDRGAVALVDDSEGGVRQIILISVFSRIKLRLVELERSRRAGAQGAAFNVQIVGDHSIAVQGHGNSVTQVHQPVAELSEIRDALERLTSQLQSIGDPKSRGQLMGEFKPVQDEILNPNTDPTRIQRWWGKAKLILQGMDTADGVLGFVGRVASLVAIWKALQ